MDETAIAFDLPHARAAATAGPAPLDRISVRDYTRTVEIGAFLTERGMTQRVRFNVVLEVAPHAAATDDDVDKVVSYDTITDAIEAAVAAERINLLETLAERIAARVLADPRAMRVFIRIEKLDRGPGALGVEIARRRPEGDAPLNRTAPILVVFLSPQQAADAGIRDGIVDQGGPLVVCLAPPQPEKPAKSEARRRVGLLSIDQAAWKLADADPRFVVAATRTELDWALKGGAQVAWAPTHMAISGVGVVPDASDPRGLAEWFAAEIGAGPVRSAADLVLETEDSR